MSDKTTPTETPIPPVRGTRDRLPGEQARLDALQGRLLDRFALAGYGAIRTPILEPTELHERKSGAGIVAKLFTVADGVCLRPELTASVVRAYADAPEPPPLPWRVATAGPVFRQERSTTDGILREFTQVGVELIGAGGPAADAEVIALAVSALEAAGIADATVRVGHVGLILEVLERSGLPPVARSALVEMLSEAAAEGGDVRALETALEQLADWLGPARDDAPIVAGGPDDGGADRLFRQLVPDVTGRRSGREIMGRLRRKWELGHTLNAVLDRVRDHVRELADLRGPAPAVLERLETWYRALAPDSVASLRALIDLLGHHGVPPERIEVDMGFGRGIGFYSRMIFELVAETLDGPIEVGGGGRYDGLSRVLGSDRDDRGVGFAIGLERLAAALDARSPRRPTEFPLFNVDCVLPARDDLVAEAIQLAVALRSQGGYVVVDPPLPPDRAAAHAREHGMGRAIIVLGPLDEAGTIVVYDLIDDRTRTVARDDLRPRNQPEPDEPKR